jgi:hypothetical protein
MGDRMDANSKAGVLERLTTKYDRQSGTAILLDGERIGSMVSFGRRSSPSASPRTVYASRIYQGARIEAEGANPRSVLAKVAAEVSRAMRSGNWTKSPATPPERPDEADVPAGPRP